VWGFSLAQNAYLSLAVQAVRLTFGQLVNCTSFGPLAVGPLTVARCPRPAARQVGLYPQWGYFVGPHACPSDPPRARHKVVRRKLKLGEWITRPLCSVVEVKVSGKKSCMMPPPSGVSTSTGEDDRLRRRRFQGCQPRYHYHYDYPCSCLITHTRRWKEHRAPER
jgi:hypothetical protein